ncbi:MAG: hypothetical protein KKC19_01340 [Nanoarchaeota archaeon]|nr:hypothetical protein [Nanoarchaeota archaeon]
MENKLHPHMSHKPRFSKHQKNLVVGSVVVFVGILVAIASILIYQSGPNEERPSDEIILNSGELIPASACSTDSQCLLTHGANSYCAFGNCYNYIIQNTPSSRSSSRSSSSGGSSSGSSSSGTNEPPTGITGFFAKFFTGNAVSPEAGNAIYYNDGYVGIGTNEPQSALDVRGQINTEDILIYSDNTQTPAWLTLKDSVSGGNQWSLSSYGNFYIAKEGLSSLPFTIDTSGNVGIGTTSPSAALTIAGDVHPSIDNTFVLGTYGKAYNKLRLGKNYGGIDWYDSTDNLVGTIYMPNNGNLLFSNFANIGIGTTSPTAKLDVNGSIRTQPQSSAPTCGSTTMGSIYYSSSSNNFLGCRKTSDYAGGVYSWVQLNN